MENKELQLSIFTKESFTDKSLQDFLANNKNFSITDYSEFLTQRTLENELAEKLVRFICTYDNGFFKPDKCNAYEPIREPFNEHNLTDPIRWLSQPGGAFYFKKLRGSQIEGAIENHQFSPIWDSDDDKNILKPKVAEPVYKGEIRLFFDERIIKVKGVEYWNQFIVTLCEISKASRGFLITTNESCDINQVNEKQIFISENARRIFFNSFINILN